MTKRQLEVLKAGILYSPLLSSFENKFIDEVSTRYSEFGLRTCVKGKQIQLFEEIADKLNV